MRKCCFRAARSSACAGVVFVAGAALSSAAVASGSSSSISALLAPIEAQTEGRLAAATPNIHRASAELGEVTPPSPGAAVLGSFDVVHACANVDLEIERRMTQVEALARRPTLPGLERFWRANAAFPADIGKGTPAPRLLLARLPQDLTNAVEVSRKKRDFIGLMLPHILAVNAEIEADRARIASIASRLDAPGEPSRAEMDWLLAQFELYGVKDHSAKKLLDRVDVIPPALAIAQAAKETGWGSSRFAQKGNALYGQWTWNPKDKGIVPKERPKGKTYRVRAFDSIKDATAAYALNLNRNAAYSRLRAIRAKLRADGKRPNGPELTGALDKYSAIGQRYVRALKQIIRANDLTRLNDAKLAPLTPMTIPAPFDAEKFASN